jgi:hypothetical protein
VRHKVLATNSDGNGKIVVHCRDLRSFRSRNQEAADVIAAKGHNCFGNVDNELFFRIVLPDWISEAGMFYTNESRSCIFDE